MTNQSGGTISGVGAGVYMKGGPGSLINGGNIHGTAASGHGAVLKGGGTVTNQSGGTISGASIGVYFGGGSGSATNAGTISGGAASLVFAGSGTNTLTLQTGSTLIGAAIGSTSTGATNALILQGHGTANNNFVSFNTLNAQGNGTWTLGGSSTFGDTMVSTGTLSVSGALTSATLEIQAAAQLNDTGDVTVTGTVNNRGNLTINGVTMHVVGAGGTFTQLTGGTTTLLNGGVLDPSNIVIDSGVFGGGGSVVGDVSVTGGTMKVGGGPGGSLKILGNFSQTGGEIAFEIDPNGVGGFLETTVVFDPSFSIGISDTTLVFDFLNGANAQQFIDDDLLNLNTFFGLTAGGQFCTELKCGTVLGDISFTSNVPGLMISGFDPTTSAIDPTMSVQAVPEPGTWALLMTGTLGLCSLKLRRRNGSRMIQTPLHRRQVFSGKIVPAHAVLGFGVSDDRLDRRSAAEFAFDRLGDAASLAGDIDLEGAAGRGVMAAIAAVGDDAGGAGADLRLDLRDHGRQRVAVIRIARQRLGAGDELATRAAMERGGERNFVSAVLTSPFPGRAWRR